jgi:phosphatidylethanolamine-binding protein (PEBP) family uncharacterized protein
MEEPVCRAPKAISGAVLLTALVLAGCGSSATTRDVPKIVFKSAAVHGASLPARYTCDGRDISPPLEWGAVPAGTGNLALFVVAFKPAPSTKTYKASVAWAVAGINPKLHKLAAGRLPRGAYLGLASGGRRYSVCPAKGTREQYQFELYGLPTSVGISPSFAGLPVLSAIASGKPPTSASAHGVFPVTYARKSS